MMPGAVPETRADQALDQVVRDHFDGSITVTEAFFEAQQDVIAGICQQWANRFQAGGRLLVFGTGASVSDAQHVSVEFVHPVIVGKRALPAIALTSDAAVLTGSEDPTDCFVRQLKALAGPRDIALGIASGRLDAATQRGLQYAAQHGLLTCALVSSGADPVHGADITTFVVPSNNPLIVQEVQETLYHVLWELVHVFLDRSTHG